MRLLCVGGVAEGRIVEFEDRDVMIVREHIRLGSPVTGTADLVQAVMQQEPYKKIILYFADENGAEMAVCAAPVRWTYRQVIQRLLSYAPVIPPEKDPFAQ